MLSDKKRNLLNGCIVITKPTQDRFGQGGTDYRVSVKMPDKLLVHRKSSGLADVMKQGGKA